MAPEDKLLGMRDDTRVYATYRIDFDSDIDPRRDVDLSGAAKCPPEGYDDHPTKPGYRRKVVVEDAQTRDEIEAVLDDEGISYEVEDVSPSQQEREDIEDYGARSGVGGAHAVRWGQSLRDLDAGRISVSDLERGRNPHRGTEFEKPSSGPVR